MTGMKAVLEQGGTCSGQPLPALPHSVFQLWPEGGCLGSWCDYIHPSLWIPTIPEVTLFELQILRHLTPGRKNPKLVNKITSLK